MLIYVFINKCSRVAYSPQRLAYNINSYSKRVLNDLLIYHLRIIVTY